MAKQNEFGTENGYLNALRQYLYETFNPFATQVINEPALFEELHLFALDKTDEIQTLSESFYIYADNQTLIQSTENIVRISHTFGQICFKKRFIFDMMLNGLRKQLPFMSKTTDEV